MTGWAEGSGPVDAGAARATSSTAAAAPTTATRSSPRSRRSRRSHEQGIPHARCVILIEACEESGSYDLPDYIDHLAARIGKPSLVVCLDSGCGNYDQLWLTTSLRGLVGGDAHGAGADRGRPFGRRLGHRALELPHPAPAPLAARGRGDRRDPACRSSTSQIPPERIAQARSRGSGAGRARSTPSSRSPAATQPMARRSASSWCSTAPGGRSSPSPASTGCRRRRTPATCCGPSPPRSSACACRRRWTPEARSRGR